MSKPEDRVTKSIAAFIFIFSCSIIFTSCKDDEKIDCDAIENQLEDIEDDIEDAIIDGDCDEVEELYDEAIAILKKGKDCDFVEDIVDDSGFDELDEFIEFLEEARDACGVGVTDCDASEERLFNLIDDYSIAYGDEDCIDMEELSEKFLAELILAESCDYIQDIINDNGYNDFQALVDDMEAMFMYNADYLGC